GAHRRGSVCDELLGARGDLASAHHRALARAVAAGQGHDRRLAMGALHAWLRRRGARALGGRGGTGAMSELAQEMTRPARAAASRGRRPKDAATLILIDRSGEVPKVLLGKRHRGHAFMPDQLVF